MAIQHTSVEALLRGVDEFFMAGGPVHKTMRTLRNVETGVEIDILTEGDYPGDGKPKPVAFPDPANASTEIDGIRILDLEKLIELKLASGMTAAHRLRDLADVQELIKLRGLGSEFSGRIDPYARGKY